MRRCCIPDGKRRPAFSGCQPCQSGRESANRHRQRFEQPRGRMDIQGGEADLVAATLKLLTEKVGYILIGTRSRALKSRLM